MQFISTTEPEPEPEEFTQNFSFAFQVWGASSIGGFEACQACGFGNSVLI